MSLGCLISFSVSCFQKGCFNLVVKGVTTPSFYNSEMQENKTKADYTWQAHVTYSLIKRQLTLHFPINKMHVAKEVRNREAGNRGVT